MSSGNSSNRVDSACCTLVKIGNSSKVRVGGNMVVMLLVGRGDP